jgi:hypothetical protein
MAGDASAADQQEKVGVTMAKVFKCRWKEQDCDRAFHGNTAQEIIEKAYPHAQSAHHCELTFEEFGAYIKDSIRQERGMWLPWTRRDAGA